MTRTETTVRSMLDGTDPLDAGYGLDVESEARAAVTLARILTTSTTATAAGTTSAHRSPRTRAASTGRMVLVGSTALVVGAVVVTATTVTLQDGPRSTPASPALSASPSTSPSGSSIPSGGGAIVARPAALTFQTVTDETASEALLRLAEAARTAPSDWQPPTDAKPYTYLHRQGWWGGTDVDGKSHIEPVDYQAWTKTDGTFRSVRGPGEPIFANDAEKQKWIDDGSPQTKPWELRNGPAENADERPSDLGELPTTVSGLDRRYSSFGIPWDGRSKMMAIEDVYMNSQIPTPATRAAMLEMLAETPGVRLDGRTVDRSGRPGLAFSAVNLQRNAFAQRLVFDEKTGVVLYSETTLDAYTPEMTAQEKREIKIGDVGQYDMYLEFGRVATDTDVPEQLQAS